MAGPTVLSRVLWDPLIQLHKFLVHQETAANILTSLLEKINLGNLSGGELKEETVSVSLLFDLWSQIHFKLSAMQPR